MEAKYVTIPSFLQEMLKKQYQEEIVNKILEGYATKRVVSFRVNTLKTKVETIQEQLRQKKIAYETVEWSKEAVIVKNVSEKEIQNLECYQKGEIYLQSLSSMLPPIVLNPQPEADILDMAAAPGGKTTQIATLSHNLAHITACEKNPIRAERLKFNIEKQGTTCVYVMVTDATKLERFFSFDQILLDAPCSGSGTLNSKNIELEKTFTPKLIQKSINTQIALLKKAIEIIKPRTGNSIFYLFCFSM